MINNDLPIVAFTTALLSACISLYYSYYHIGIMDTYPFKLEGGSALFASVVVALSLSYFLKVLWNERTSLPGLFRPSVKRLCLCLVIAFFTPLVNLLWIPIPFGAPAVLGLINGAFGFRTAQSAALISMLVIVPAYGVACLSSVETSSFGRLVLPVLLYLAGAFSAVTLFTGITYI